MPEFLIGTVSLFFIQVLGTRVWNRLNINKFDNVGRKWQKASSIILERK
jgi:hypothetical protein